MLLSPFFSLVLPSSSNPFRLSDKTVLLLPVLYVLFPSLSISLFVLLSFTRDLRLRLVPLFLRRVSLSLSLSHFFAERFVSLSRFSCSVLVHQALILIESTLHGTINGLSSGQLPFLLSSYGVLARRHLRTRVLFAKSIGDDRSSPRAKSFDRSSRCLLILCAPRMIVKKFILTIIIIAFKIGTSFTPLSNQVSLGKNYF